jgi:hypothetical protein
VSCHYWIVMRELKRLWKLHNILILSWPIITLINIIWTIFKKCMKGGSVTHACNPSYSEGRDQEDFSSKPAWANSLWDPILKNPSPKIGLVEWLKVKAWVQTLVPPKKKKAWETINKLFKFLKNFYSQFRETILGWNVSNKGKTYIIRRQSFPCERYICFK